jgi:hypothetical protein
MDDHFLEFLAVAVDYRQRRMNWAECKLKLACALAQMTREDVDDLTQLLSPFYGERHDRLAPDR